MNPLDEERSDLELPDSQAEAVEPATAALTKPLGPNRAWRRGLRIAAVALPVLALLAAAGFYGGRAWMQRTLKQDLPVVDGRLVVDGLSAPVTVLRDAQGVPHIKAATMDDLVFAQGFVTASDRLWQLDALRRNGVGALAEVLGKSFIGHDKAQRILGMRASADRALAVLPADQRHWLDVYARGINASMHDQEEHLPLEFRLLGYKPAPWTPSDSVVVGLVMFQDLSTSFPGELDREALQSRLAPEMVDDLYPVGSWRDHPPEQPTVDLTAPQPAIQEVPLDESQSTLRRPSEAESKSGPGSEPRLLATDSVKGLLKVRKTLGILSDESLCEGCRAGSNGWAVAGSKTQSGKPMLASDMHLRHNVPGIWYEADLQAPLPEGGLFHVAGVTLPGTPFVIVGHNQHIAWGFTNLGAKVQDLYVEQTRGTGAGIEFQGSDQAWHPVQHRQEVIRVRGAADVVLDVLSTEHGGVATPVITGLYAGKGPGAGGIYPRENRVLALDWTVYDPANVTLPFFAVNAANDWASLLRAMAGFGGPGQNMMYADDQGHIGYHAVGKVPVRGVPPAASLAVAQAMRAEAEADAAKAAADAANDAANDAAGAPASQANPEVPSALQGMLLAPKPIWTALSPVPVDGRDPRQQWAGYIPFDQMPQAYDPPGGVLATANARVTPKDYPYAITLNWSDPYRNERIWKVLDAKHGLVPADMLQLQTDVYSGLDRVIAERLAYAIDHSALAGYKPGAGKPSSRQKRLRQAADLMRAWDGTVSLDSSAAAIVDATRTALWPLLLEPQVGDGWRLYGWGEKQYAEEQIVVHQPGRWLPARYPNWNELLATAVERGLAEGRAPFDLTKWKYGQARPIAIEHPIYEQSPVLERMIGMRTGTGVQPQSGDGSTVKQVGPTFGPSERLTVDFGNLDGSTLNLVLGESADPVSPWFMDQWKAWYGGTTFPMPFSDAATQAAAKHALVLVPKGAS